MQRVMIEHVTVVTPVGAKHEHGRASISTKRTLQGVVDLTFRIGGRWDRGLLSPEPDIQHALESFRLMGFCAQDSRRQCQDHNACQSDYRASNVLGLMV